LVEVVDELAAEAGEVGENEALVGHCREPWSGDLSKRMPQDIANKLD
jgi:hypothetical protein